jgi:5-methyltetrahydropteroyltriglutamate--homocysteine methyltransferase
VIDSTSNYIEHPQVVADRIVRFAKLVGRENVIAGVDCGFSTFAEAPTVHPTLVWAKLTSLVDGAALASKELWGKDLVPARKRRGSAAPATDSPAD